MPPEQADTPAPVPEAAKLTPFWERKIVWISLALILLGGGGYFFLNPQPAPQIATTDSIGWKTYQNPEIGISFEYPESWGTIETEREEVCTKGLDGPFGSDEAEKEKTETGDPCVSIYIGTSGSAFHESRPTSLLFSQSPLFAKFQPRRGANWTSRVSQIKDSAFIENYCTDRTKVVEDLIKQTSAACSNPQFSDNSEVKYYCSENPQKDCSVFTNSQGVRIAKGFEVSNGMGGFYGWLYFIQSPNPFFPAIILGSSGALGDPKHEEFGRFVDSIRITIPGASSLIPQGAVLIQSRNQNEASIILIDAQTGDKKEIVQITNVQSWKVVPKVVADQGMFYYLGGHNEMVRRDSATGAVEKIQPFNVYKASEITDFAVNDDTLVYLVKGQVWEDKNPPSSECSLGVVDLARLNEKTADSHNVSIETVILDIPICEQAHGPNYSLGEISNGKVMLFESYGEAGFVLIKRHEINIGSKIDTVVETVSYNPRCSEGKFYNAEECTQDVRSKNVQYDAFQKQYQLGYGWNTQCGNISVRKDDKEYYTLHISAAGKDYSVEDAGYAGCLK